jgi:hypothetical protein
MLRSIALRLLDFPGSDSVREDALVADRVRGPLLAQPQVCSLDAPPWRFTLFSPRLGEFMLYIIMWRWGRGSWLLCPCVSLWQATNSATAVLTVHQHGCRDAQRNSQDKGQPALPSGKAPIGKIIPWEDECYTMHSNADAVPHDLQLPLLQQSRV